MVTRIADDPRWGVVLQVHGKLESVQIRVTPGGRLRMEKVEKTSKYNRDGMRTPEVLEW